MSEIISLHTVLTQTIEFHSKRTRNSLHQPMTQQTLIVKKINGSIQTEMTRKNIITFAKRLSNVRVKYFLDNVQGLGESRYNRWVCQWRMYLTVTISTTDDFVMISLV